MEMTVPAGPVRELETRLGEAGLEMTPRQFLTVALWCAASSAILAWLLAPAVISFILLGALAGLGAPFGWLWRTAAARHRRFEEQLLPTVVQLAEALRGGRSMTDALSTVARTSRAPMSRVLRLVVTDLENGLPLEAALRGLRDRARQDDVTFFVAAVTLQHQAGGSLGTLLDGIAETLRQRFRLRDLVRSLTAQGRLTGLILGALPVGVGLYMYWMVPAHISKLWSFAEPGSFLNYLPLTGCALLELVGFLWIRKTMTIEL